MIDLNAKRLNGPVIRLHPDDNVVVARVDIEPGTVIPGENVVARQKAPAGYKIATQHLRKGDPVLKYQVTIGFAEPVPRHARLELERLPGVKKAEVMRAIPAVLRAGHRSYRTALTGLDLRVPARSTLGIVGGTGAGKTSLVDVVLGLLWPDQGEIRVDGVKVARKNLRAWQDNVGYVPQQISLIDDSVAANIAFGVPSERVDMAAVERAARIAELHDFVRTELPDGYATRVGDRGVRLSGGQRQRIGIARALYRDPDVLILDEATSALDNLTEKAVMDAVHNLGHAKTIIMIAHRLSTVRGCDAIIMMEQGQIVASGTYEELLGSSTKFRAMAEVGGA